MGLDIFLYRRDKKRKRISAKDATKELIELLNHEAIKEIKQLKEYSKYIDKPFIECLKEAIVNYIDEIPAGLDSEEVCHCKNLWSVLCMFHDYNESGRNRVLKENEVKELFKLVGKSLCEVECHFEDKGFEIVKSPMNEGINNLTLQKEGICTEVIVRGNSNDELRGKVDHEIEIEANEICWKRFYYYYTDPANKLYDAWIYERLIALYKDLQKIINETDFKTKEIVMNAGW